MAANYHRPKPIDPVSYRSHAYLQARCRCGHAITEQLGRFAARHRVPGNTAIYELIARLRCSACGAKTISAEVTLYARGN
jgi:hypothetical protein